MRGLKRGEAREPRATELRLVARYRWLLLLACAGFVMLGGFLLLALFAPPLPYNVSWSHPELNDSPEFQRTLFVLTSGWVDRNSGLEVLTNGEVFYPAQIAAIRAARRSVHLTAYIFRRGKVASQYLDALTERARAGIEVKIVIDTVGSGRMLASDFKQLTDAGGRVAWYRPMKWYTLPRFGKRTHREILVVDGETGFIGGAGVADHWRFGSNDEPRWRDLMVRVAGEAVPGLQASFAENWLEATGEILAASRHYTRPAPAGAAVSLVVNSTPTTGRSTPARILFQTLLASARKRIHIQTPYFLPDHALRDEIARAAHERHVEVRVIVPGKHADHWVVRAGARRLYGELLKAGVEIYEFDTAMNHTKAMLIDDLWTVVGSTNFDSRSFGLNDEVNLAVRDTAFARRLEKDFSDDLGHSRRIRYDEWKNRNVLKRIGEWLGWLLERQE